MKDAERQRIFEEWLGQYQGLLFKVVRAYAFTPEEQEDLFQEVTLQVWDSIPRFQGDSKVSTWIYRVALYVALSWKRKEGHHARRTQPLQGVEHLLGRTSRHQDKRLEWLYQQLARLEPLDRSLMLLQLEGFSYQEMAETLGLSESNVGVKLNRLKKKLTLKAQEEKLHEV